jgi:hypothetical protein
MRSLADAMQPGRFQQRFTAMDGAGTGTEDAGRCQRGRLWADNGTASVRCRLRGAGSWRRPTAAPFALRGLCWTSGDTAAALEDFEQAILFPKCGAHAGRALIRAGKAGDVALAASRAIEPARITISWFQRAELRRAGRIRRSDQGLRSVVAWRHVTLAARPGAAESGAYTDARGILARR